jgi:hypothetical protein
LRSYYALFYCAFIGSGLILHALGEKDSIVEYDSKVSTRNIEDIGTICTIQLKILYPFWPGTIIVNRALVYARFISFNQYPEISNYEECYATFHGFRAAGYSRPASSGDATLE